MKYKLGEIFRCGLAVACLVLLILFVALLLSGSAYIDDAPTIPPGALTIEQLEELGNYALVDMGVFTVTAYCPCVKCCGKSPDNPLYGITATGTTVTEGRTIAVDPAVIPYGTVVFIDGKDYIAEDCGGFKGRHIDIYMEEHDTAIVFGVQELHVYIFVGEG